MVVKALMEPIGLNARKEQMVRETVGFSGCLDGSESERKYIIYTYQTKLHATSLRKLTTPFYPNVISVFKNFHLQCVMFVNPAND